ncbi:Alpha/Beta hydrolase protein [Phycomyces nitens]|nr:Alpha/Beta hydrolase protein [Phycomyces nitens]
MSSFAFMADPVFKLGLPNWLAYFLTFTGLAGVAASVLLYIYQCELIYPRTFPEGSRTDVAKPSDFDMKYADETLITKDNVKLHAYIIILENEQEARAAPTILYFHANAGNMGHRLPIAKVLHQKHRCNVVMLSYRGYGHSEGKPNEKGLRIDSQTLLDYVKTHPILRHTRLVAYGQSIGGAVAIDLVSRNEDSFSGLMIENTFLSLPKLIPSVMPMLRYVTFLCHQQWPSESSIRHIVKTPLLFLAGEKDELIPPSHMLALYDLSETRASKDFCKFSQGMHNDTCMQPGYFSAIREYLDRRIREEEPEEIPFDSKRSSSNQTIETVDLDSDSEPYELVSGLADEHGKTHSFEVEELELDMDD